MALFHRYTQADVAAGNAVCRLAAIAARTFDLKLSAAHTPVERDALEVFASLDQTECRIIVPLPLAHVVARRFFSLARDHTIPDELLAAALEATLSDGLDALEKASGIAIAIRQIQFVQNYDYPEKSRYFHLAGLGTQAVLGVVPVPQLALLQMPLPACLPEEQLVLKLRLLLGEVTLGLAELKRLASGDVVLLSPAADREHIQVDLALDVRHVGRASLRQDKLTILDRTNAVSVEESGTTSEDSSNSAASVAPLDDVALKLVFDLGELEQSLQETRALTPGQIIDLGRIPAQAVRVSVNGHRIASGEIVEIEGRLGVRILELAGRNEPPAA
jgi:type III secretion protein Q